MKFTFATITLCLMLSASVPAQTRSRRTTPQRRRTPATSRTAGADETQKNAARIRLADQIKNLTRFLYLYGRFSKDLELTGTQAQSDVTQRTRAQLLDSLRNIREGLDQLEAQFRLTPGLDTSYRRMQGVAQQAEDAETQAAAGRLDQAGRLLIEVVNRLTDVLVEM